jgi:hypothetical protein
VLTDEVKALFDSLNARSPAAGDVVTIKIARAPSGTFNLALSLSNDQIERSFEMCDSRPDTKWRLSCEVMAFAA